MNPVLYLLLTLFGGYFGLHKFATGKAGMGILYLCTVGLFGIGWLYDIIQAFKNLSVSKQPEQYEDMKYINSLYAEMNRDYYNHEQIRKSSEKYFKGLEEIESIWSVMYNLKITAGEKAELFERKCEENIVDLYSMLEAKRKYGYDDSVPPHVPAYVRLAMLYEKQSRYQEAIDICVEAIKAGAVDDGNKSKMYGRLARLIRKSGITVSDEVLTLSMKA